MTSAAARAFAQIAVRVERGERAERVAAEAFAAGACGLEERDVSLDSSHTVLLLYAPVAEAERVRLVVCALLEEPERVGDVEPVAPVDWSTAWRAGLTAEVISPRLVVRPSFVPHEARPGQATLVIDPGEAFGTGGHASTRLALELCDSLRECIGPATTVLDVGTGTGVLALAALRAGATRAVALDCDPRAAATAAANAGRNGLAGRLLVLCGELAALAPRRFDLVLANMLRSEVTPLVPELATRLAAGGRAVFSGLLSEEGEAFRETLGRAALRVETQREQTDTTGDRWLAFLTTH